MKRSRMWLVLVAIVILLFVRVREGLCARPPTAPEVEAECAALGAIVSNGQCVCPDGSSPV
jgi:hypothetical protein